MQSIYSVIPIDNTEGIDYVKEKNSRYANEKTAVHIA